MVPLPPDLDLAHAVAVMLIFALWFGYGPILKIFFEGSLNQRLAFVRTGWLTAALTRPQRPFDAILIGHLVNSITFFGSATMLVLAGTASMIIAAPSGHAALSTLSQGTPSSLALFVLNVLVLNVVLAGAFFAFTYALRKLIYLIALFGALPEKSEQPGQDTRRTIMVQSTSHVLTSALMTFNFGIRGYYYAVASLGLFVSPYLSMALSVFFTSLLIYRQVFSSIAGAIGSYVEAEADYGSTKGR